MLSRNHLSPLSMQHPAPRTFGNFTPVSSACGVEMAGLCLKPSSSPLGLRCTSKNTDWIGFFRPMVLNCCANTPLHKYISSLYVCPGAKGLVFHPILTEDFSWNAVNAVLVLSHIPAPTCRHLAQPAQLGNCCSFSWSTEMWGACSPTPKTEILMSFTKISHTTTTTRPNSPHRLGKGSTLLWLCLSLSTFGTDSQAFCTQFPACVRACCCAGGREHRTFVLRVLCFSRAHALCSHTLSGQLRAGSLTFHAFLWNLDPNVKILCHTIKVAFPCPLAHQSFLVNRALSSLAFAVWNNWSLQFTCQQ